MHFTQFTPLRILRLPRLNPPRSNRLLRGNIALVRSCAFMQAAARYPSQFLKGFDMARPGKYPRYLTKQGDTFLVRIKINDPEIRGIIGKSELIRSLRTGWLAEAIRRSHPVIAEFLARINAARQQKAGITAGITSPYQSSKNGGFAGLSDAPRIGDEHPAGIGQGFDPCRDVDAVAIEVVALDDHVAEIDADAQLDTIVAATPGSRSGI